MADLLDTIAANARTREDVLAAFRLLGGDHTAGLAERLLAASTLSLPDNPDQEPLDTSFDSYFAEFDGLADFPGLEDDLDLLLDPFPEEEGDESVSRRRLREQAEDEIEAARSRAFIRLTGDLEIACRDRPSDMLLVEACGVGTAKDGERLLIAYCPWDGSISTFDLKDIVAYHNPSTGARGADLAEHIGEMLTQWLVA